VVFTSALSTMFEHVRHGIQRVTSSNTIALILALYMPVMREQETATILVPKYCAVLANLDTKQRFEFAFAFQESIQFTAKSATDNSNLFKSAVQILQQNLTLLILEESNIGKEPSSKIIDAVQSLSILGS
jgi:hypothetical protein